MVVLGHVGRHRREACFAKRERGGEEPDEVSGVLQLEESFVRNRNGRSVGHDDLELRSVAAPHCKVANPENSGERQNYLLLTINHALHWERDSSALSANLPSCEAELWEARRLYRFHQRKQFRGGGGSAGGDPATPLL